MQFYKRKSTIIRKKLLFLVYVQDKLFRKLKTNCVSLFSIQVNVLFGLQ